jgi:hypothetical protein
LSKKSRDKGAGYEREVAAQIYGETGHKLQRKLGQARDGGSDLDDLGGIFVIECKRRKTLGTVYGWLRQVIAAVKWQGQIPMVVAREDNGTSFVIIGLNDFLRVAQGKVVLPPPVTLAETPANG